MKKLKARLREREISGLSRWTVIGLIIGAVAGAIISDFSENSGGIWIILGAVIGLISGAGIGYLSGRRQRNLKKVTNHNQELSRIFYLSTAYFSL